MNWVILVYLAIWTTGPQVMKYTMLEFSAEINDIKNAYKSKTSYVRSFYWVYNNMLDDIKAKCVYADPKAPMLKWAE